MQEGQQRTISYVDPAVSGAMTPAERWTFIGDSYHDSPGGRQYIHNRNDWFVPVDVLEGRATMAEVLSRRNTFPPIKTTSISMFTAMKKLTTNQGDIAALRLLVPHKEDGTIDESVTVIAEPSKILVLKSDGTEVAVVTEGEQQVSITDSYFVHLKEHSTFNPYIEDPPAGEGIQVPPDGGMSRR